MEIYLSRHTPGVTACEILLEIDDVCTYQLFDGTHVEIKITSGKMSHAQADIYGYEAIFSDTGELGFADCVRIISWKGRKD